MEEEDMSKRKGPELLESGERFSVTMWEYSWLVQREGLKKRKPLFGPENEYADWDKVLDELVERGYDCIRIDAHPHLIAAGPHGKSKEEFVMLPIDDHFMWGNHEEVSINPRKDVVEFMKKCKQRDISVGLSSWYNDDTDHRKFMVKSPADYSRIWNETLTLLDDAGLLDIVVWVDLCNEFPLPGWAAYAFADIFGKQEVSTDTWAAFTSMGGPWSDKTVRRFGEYFTESIEGVRKNFPRLKYTFSLITLGAEKIMNNVDTSAFDLLEPHIWTTDDSEWMKDSGMMKVNEGEPGEGLRAFVEQVRELYPESRKRCDKILDELTSKWASWSVAPVQEISTSAPRSGERPLPLVTTEAWTTVLYEDVSPNGKDGEWEWFKDIAEIGVRYALEKGWQGICTSNFSEPHFEGMWRDVDWHRRMTKLIRDG